MVHTTQPGKQGNGEIEMAIDNKTTSKHLNALMVNDYRQQNQLGKQDNGEIEIAIDNKNNK